jgi:hypothetical protein
MGRSVDLNNFTEAVGNIVGETNETAVENPSAKKY